MGKSLLYRLFGTGAMPESVLTELGAEGILFFSEGIRASLIYKNFRSPERHLNWRRQGFPGSIALSRTRLVGFGGSQPLIDVALNDPRLRKIEFSVEEAETFVAAFDAGLFQPDWSGRLEHRFKTPVAKPLFRDLQEKMSSGR